MHKSLLIFIVLIISANAIRGQSPSGNNTLPNSGVTSIASTTSTSYKLSINGAIKQYGTNTGTSLTVTSPTLFLQNTTATNGRHFAINSDNSGLFQIVDVTASNAPRFVINNLGYIGIGNTNPTSRLHITGTGGSFRLEDGTQGAGKVLTSDANGLASWQPSGGGGVTLNSTQIAFGNGSNQLSSSSDFTWNGTKLMLGNFTAAGLTSPVSINTGATYGSNTPGTSGNLKLKLFDDNIGNVYGLGVSSTVMEYQVPPGSDHRFYTGGTENMRLASTGNLGINTSTPAYKLHVKEPAANTLAAVFEGGGGAGVLRVRPISGSGAVDIGFTGTGQDMYIVGSNVTSGFRIVGASSPLHLETDGNLPIRFKTSNTERMIIDGSGNVGIGTSSPTSKFQVHGNSYFSSYQSTMQLNATKLQWRGSDALLNGVLGDDGTLEIQGVNELKQTVVNGSMLLRAQNFSNIKFQTTDNNTDRLVIQNDGKIGIGTSSPSTQLHTTGGVRFQGITQDDALTKILAADVDGNLSWRNASTLGGGGSSQWTTNGSSIYYNTGNVGIGIPSPAYPLHVAPVQYSSGTASQSGTAITGSSVVWTDAMLGSYLVFADGTRRTVTAFIDATHLTVAESGTVGSQAYKIHYPGLGVASNGQTTIANSDWVEDLLTVKSGIGTWGSGVAKFVSVSPYASGTYNTVVCAFAPNVPLGTNINAYQFGKDRLETNNSATWLFRYNGNLSASNYVALAFWGSPEIVRFKPTGVTEFDGNVGIGTTNPTNKLHVNGSVKLEGLSTQNGYAKILAGDGTGNLAWRDASTLGGSGSSQWLNAGSNIFYDGGNVSIGLQTIPTGYKLAVAGSIITEKIKVKLQSNGWPDYVFHPNYELLPLKSLESFIQKNKHLPEVPSAADVEANGLDLGDNQSLMLKKIEELTLYLIELNKKVDKLAEENAILKKKLETNKK